jgi:hypothetical protein
MWLTCSSGQGEAGTIQFQVRCAHDSAARMDAQTTHVQLTNGEKGIALQVAHEHIVQRDPSEGMDSHITNAYLGSQLLCGVGCEALCDRPLDDRQQQQYRYSDNSNEQRNDRIARPACDARQPAVCAVQLQLPLVLMRFLQGTRPSHQK